MGPSVNQSLWPRERGKSIWWHIHEYPNPAWRIRTGWQGSRVNGHHAWSTQTEKGKGNYSRENRNALRSQVGDAGQAESNTCITPTSHHPNRPKSVPPSSLGRVTHKETAESKNPHSCYLLNLLWAGSCTTHFTYITSNFTKSKQKGNCCLHLLNKDSRAYKN